MFLKASAMERNFFEMKKGCKDFCVKTIACGQQLLSKGTNTLVFYIFECGAEYGAKQYSSSTFTIFLAGHMSFSKSLVPNF